MSKKNNAETRNFICPRRMVEEYRECKAREFQSDDFVIEYKSYDENGITYMRSHSKRPILNGEEQYVPDEEVFAYRFFTTYLDGNTGAICEVDYTSWTYIGVLIEEEVLLDYLERTKLITLVSAEGKSRILRLD